MVDPITELLDLQVLVNELVGGVTLFIILGVLAIAYFSAKFNVPFGAGFLLAMLFLMIVVVGYGQSYPLVWVLAVTVVGLVFYLVVAKIMKR